MIPFNDKVRCVPTCGYVCKLQLRRVVRDSERRKVMRFSHRVGINESSFILRDVCDVECDRLNAIHFACGVTSDQER